MSNTNREIYEFDKFRLDVAERLLSRKGDRVQLPEKAFDTLCALVRHASHLVRKDDLLNEVWRDAIVEQNNLDKNISLLRRVLGERTGKGKFIETVRGYGFRFVPDVHEIEEEEKATKTVAILPFKSLVANQPDAALGVGMADALICKLSDSEEIIVRPLNAIRQYDSPEQDSIAAGRELKTEAVVDGSVQTSADKIRVLARLLRVSDGKQLWAAHFDERFTDIFAVQDSISQRVATVLKIRLAKKKQKHYTDNIEAYQLYMKGRLHALRLTRSETDKAIAYFQHAIELDPNYALPHLGLARAYLPMALTSGLPSWEVMPKAKEAALRALEIDPSIGESHATMGLISFWYEWDWQAAEKQYMRALDLHPKSADAHFGYAHLLSNSGQHEKALDEIKLSRELDPLSLVTNALEGQILFFAQCYDEALDRLQETIDLEPNFWLSHLFISRVYGEKGMHAEAVAEAKRAGELSGNSQSSAYRAYALAKWDKLSEARAVLDELLMLSTERYVPPYNLALVYNGLGEREKALDYLEKGFAERDVRMVFLKIEPQWNNLRSEPRFIDLLKRMRLASS